MKKLAAAVLALCWLWVFASAWREPSLYQFDFKTYYLAAQVADSGQSPYDVHILRETGGNAHILPFYYPPSTLLLIRPAGRLEYATAHRLWLAIKAIALLLLLLVWKRYFLKRADWWVILGAALLAFQAALVWDVTVGNVAVFEQMFLWGGFAFLLRRRTTAFVICIVLASIAKLTPIVFLSLLFLPTLRSRSNTLRAVAGVLTLGAITLVPFLATPGLLPEFARGLFSQHPRLEFNPSILGVVDELSVLPGTPAFAHAWVRWATVIAYYTLLFLCSRRLVARTFSSGSIERCIYIAVLLYALAMPRLIVYSYAIVIVPALALLLPLAGNQRVGVYAVLAAMCFDGLGIIPTAVGKFVSDVAPWLLLWGIWLTLVVLDRGVSADSQADNRALVPDARLTPTIP